MIFVVVGRIVTQREAEREERSIRVVAAKERKGRRCLLGTNVDVEVDSQVFGYCFQISYLKVS